MPKRLAGLLLLLSLPGCLWAIREQRERDKLSTWLGHPITEVVSAWGAPSSTLQNGPGAVYEWRWVGDTAAHTNPWTGGVSVSTQTCREWFDIDSIGRIAGAHWEGQC